MPGRVPKTTAAIWVETARRALIEEGIAGVKVDRLAQRLGVTRGGFYHNFKDRDELLDALLHHWQDSCRFLPEAAPGGSPQQALRWLDEFVHDLIEESRYDPHFDLAVREWARSDGRASWAVERADRDRLAGLEAFFGALGYDAAHAEIRSRVFYYHQIGYYAIGVKQTPAERKRRARLYVEIICGAEALARAREAAQA